MMIKLINVIKVQSLDCLFFSMLLVVNQEMNALHSLQGFVSYEPWYPLNSLNSHVSKQYLNV